MRSDQRYEQELLATIQKLQETISFAEREMASSIVSDSLLRLANAGRSMVPDLQAPAMKKLLEEVAHQQIGLLKDAGIDFALPVVLLHDATERQLASLALIEHSVATPMLRAFQQSLQTFNFARCGEVLLQTMSQSLIDVSDLAFIRLDEMAAELSKEQRYARGLKTVISDIRPATAHRLTQCESLQFQTKEKRFIVEATPDATASVGEMNVLCSGAILLDAVCDTDERFDEAELVSFMNKLDESASFASEHPTGQKILALIREQCDIVGFDRDVYYHARALPEGGNSFLNSEMLTAPHGVTGAGRYNRPGNAYYYFADTKQGAESEVKKHNAKAAVQIAAIRPITPIRLLDLSGNIKGCKHFLDHIRFGVSDSNSRMPREYLIPNFVSDCCRELHIEGIKYYGSKEYCNYVSWRDRYFEIAS